MDGRHNHIGGSMLIIEGLVIMIIGSIQFFSGMLFGVPLVLFEALSESMSRMYVFIEIAHTLYIITLFGGLLGVIGGYLVLEGDGVLGKRIANYSTIGCSGLISPLVLFLFKQDFEEAARTVLPGVKLDILGIGYFLTWIVFALLYATGRIIKVEGPKQLIDAETTLADPMSWILPHFHVRREKPIGSDLWISIPEPIHRVCTHCNRNLASHPNDILNCPYCGRLLERP